MNTAAKAQLTSLSIKDRATNASLLVQGLAPLVKSGVLGAMGPVAAGKALKGIIQWKFLPSGLLAIAAARDGKRPAIIDDHGELSYQQLHEQSTTLAKALFRAGLRERNKIGVLCRNHRGFILALCAHGRLGTDLVLLNTAASAQQTRAVIHEQKLDVLFIDEEFLPLLPKDFDDCPIVVAWEFGDTSGLSAEAEAALPTASNVQDAIDSGNYAERSEDWSSLQEILRTTPDNLSIPSIPRQGHTIILTSGTTGTPKGARRPEPQTYMPASSIMSRIPMKKHVSNFISAPLFHTWGFAHIQLCMALRDTMIFQRRFSPEDTFQLIAKHQPHTIAMVPTMLRRLLEVVPEGFESKTEIIATSGEALPIAVIEDTFSKFGDVLYNLYGSTEVSWASIARPHELREHPRTAGTPPLATTLKIIGDNGKPMPDGEVGRIFVKNDMLFEGYTRPGNDKEIIDGMVATGDLGYYQDGLLFISGRSDDMIVSGGENVYPQETEDIILAMTDLVQEAAVRGVEDDKFGQALCAWVVLKEGVSEEEFKKQAIAATKQKLARHSVPRHFMFLDKLPRNGVGKVVPRELPQP